MRLMRGQNVKGKGRSEVLPQTQAFAAQEILNRGWGRPATAITGEGCQLAVRPVFSSTRAARQGPPLGHLSRVRALSHLGSTHLESNAECSGDFAAS